RRMNWKLLKYVYAFSTIGIALSKEERYQGWTKYQYPSKIRQMGSSRASRNKLEEISKKLGEKLHISLNESKSMMPFVALLLEYDEKKFAEQLELDEDEIQFIQEFR
ncbi:MAG: hypothetical protein BRC26_01545, partial [Nanohaloarchaea archaeon QH_8_44_6]